MWFNVKIPQISWHNGQVAFSNVTDLTSLCDHKHKTNRGSAAWEVSKKSSQREVSREISSISGKGAEKRQNMKLKRYIEKINKQKELR